ncbi:MULTISPECIES: tripartite tricarboxylate transporter TctB family protein [Nioella]|jgi:putative tricarboxylic transport membrane protein|uniref:tripartite tricarboxylate transporter TctB family protein n=1 Tax=Nioella TaxID=1775424 RepID=UPI0008FD55C1|nr:MULTISPECIES: tripartite tricarboxylate transporter TctB family protein [Nioella]TBX24658.1 membrane protein [Roseovarius sp. JS7-11]
MALDRWIALAFVAICCVYGYAAFFTMDHLLPPILQRNPIWPSTFPKILAIAGVIVGLFVLLSPKPAPKDGEEAKDGVIDLSRIGDYHVGQAIALLALMVAYAMTLRSLGFLGATIGFLVLGGTILGERKFHIMIPVAAIAAGSIWYLVQEVLGIYLSPLPSFL